MLMRGLDRSEIEAAADRNLAIIKAMFNIVNRALLGDPTKIMAFIPVIFRKHFVNLSNCFFRN